MFARIENGVVAEYPLTEHDIRTRYPNTSFTTNFVSGLPDGYVQVMRTGVPVADADHTVQEERPAYLDGMWVQIFSVNPKGTPEEIAARDAERERSKWQNLRDERDDKINECTFRLERHREQKELGIATSMSDAEYGLWLQYRQQLRDFPSTISSIYDNIVWPKAPNELSVAGV